MHLTPPQSDWKTKPPASIVTYVCQNAACSYTVKRNGAVHPADVPICHERRMTPGAVEMKY
jgi:hypothetical protein